MKSIALSPDGFFSYLARLKPFHAQKEFKQFLAAV